HRADAALAAWPAGQRRGLGAALVCRRLAFHRLRAAPGAAGAGAGRPGPGRCRGLPARLREVAGAAIAGLRDGRPRVEKPRPKNLGRKTRVEKPGSKKKKPPGGGLFTFVHPAVPAWGGGRYRVRTCDPYHVKVVLYR